jgi:hypothetical protein
MASSLTLWVPRTSSTSHDQAVLVDQATGASLSPDAVLPVQLQVPGQQPRQRGDHRAVSPVRLRSADLAAQDSDLVPQYQDLYVFGCIAACKQGSQPNNRIMSR